MASYDLKISDSMAGVKFDDEIGDACIPVSVCRGKLLRQRIEESMHGKNG